jgi:hypothetical protein
MNGEVGVRRPGVGYDSERVAPVLEPVRRSRRKTSLYANHAVPAGPLAASRPWFKNQGYPLHRTAPRAVARSRPRSKCARIWQAMVCSTRHGLYFSRDFLQHTCRMLRLFARYIEMRYRAYPLWAGGVHENALVTQSR